MRLGADPATLLRFGLALHVGEVLQQYRRCNRLDFTAIGPVVNPAARWRSWRATSAARSSLPAACRGLSQAFASLGELTLRGVAAPQPAFGLTDDG
jgi:class 3 adenylate cyclase